MKVVNGHKINEAFEEDNPRNCPVLEFTADGYCVGTCYFYMEDGKTCPRHGVVKEMDKRYFDCQCDSSEHVIRFVIDKDVGRDGTPYEDVYLEFQLSQPDNWFHRLWKGIRYIFGYQCKFGHWDCVLLKDNDREEIIKILEKK